VKIGSLKVGSREIGFPEVGFPKVSSQKVGIHKMGPFKDGSMKVGSREVGSLKAGAMKIGAPQVRSNGYIFFSPFIPIPYSGFKYVNMIVRSQHGNIPLLLFVRIRRHIGIIFSI
jgi:hypothetical protein